MKPFVADITIDTTAEIISFFAISKCEIKKTKASKQYLALELSDKTGLVSAKVWDIPADLDTTSLVVGAVVKVRATVSVWNEKVDLAIKNIRLAESHEFDMAEIVEMSHVSPNKIFSDVVAKIDECVKDPGIHSLLTDVLHDNRSRLLNAPAAKSIHHCYAGGLLEHILSLMDLAEFVSKKYGLDMSLMMAGCVMHDIGKLEELSLTTAVSYTKIGSLVGHIPIGMLWAAKYWKKDLPEDRLIDVLHIIVSHHGRLEWGSSKVPMSREAVVFHQLDMLDSRIAMFDRTVKMDQNPGEFTSYVAAAETMFYKGGAK